MTILETDRLILRDLQESDLPALIAMNQDPEVMQYFPKPYSQAESLRLYQGIQDEAKAYGYSLWAVEEKTSQEFIGLVGQHHSDLRIFAGKEAIEIGWRLRKEFWNRSYATEAAQACLDFAFQQAGLSEVYSFTSLLNLPSQKVMQKLGMEFVKEFNNEKVPAASPLYRHTLYRIKNLH
ncbi:GNAT family N-acetyltransferase [Streptococcus sanguinis]|uniref:GNAT family N-acetyltransferase n=1 Tax=Streptococcus sanguinis TaxID=1305 RepID=A0A7H8V0V8_STRSA|nr:GNAT family N-acetyltransferase [Streptococcus sanguinis]QLB50080.1 GNAT family N-acetyltransferase [Streptococcus sanguinis]